MSTDHARRLDALRRRRERLAGQQAKLTADVQEAVDAARAAGMPVREIARRLGMSEQSVHRHYLHRDPPGRR